MAQRRADDEQVHLLSNSPINQTSYSSQAQSASPESQPTTFRFESSSQFRLLRFLLRFLSLWCPRSACCFERWLYPLLVNLLLFVMVVLPFINYGMLFGWEGMSDRIGLLGILAYCLYGLMNMSAWLSHIAAVVYFRSRDVEDNMTTVVLPETEIKVFRKRLMYFNLRITTSLVMVPLYGFSALTLWPWSTTFERNFDANFVECFALATSPHLVGMYISIFWVIDLLHITARARLRNQYLKFQTWKENVDALIFNHTKSYTAKVRKSCRLLRYWFGIHNNLLFVILPTFLLIYLGTLFMFAIYGIVFVGLALILLLVWALPFYFISELQNDEERFCSEVNEFRVVPPGPGVTLMIDVDNNHFNVDRPQNLTFSLRSNLEVFVFFLKEVKPSFSSARYISQLKTALFSLFLTFFMVINRRLELV